MDTLRAHIGSKLLVQNEPVEIVGYRVVGWKRYLIGMTGDGSELLISPRALLKQNARLDRINGSA